MILVNEPGVVSSEYYDIYAHGAQSWTIIEPLQDGTGRVAGLSRFDADATPVILRGLVLDGIDPVEPFDLDLAGDGPSFVQVWRRGTQVQVAYGPVGGCPQAAP